MTKHLFLLTCLIFLAASSNILAGPSAKIGDSEDDVIIAVGEPTARLTIGEETTLYFDRGEVVFKDGKVIKSSLVSPDEAAALKKKKEQEKAAREAAREEARKERIEKGTKEKAARLADSSFSELPPAKRLAYWRTFQKTYPEIDVTNQIKPLEEKVAIKKETIEESSEQLKNDIAKLEKELSDAKARNSGLSRRGIRLRKLKIAKLEKEIAALKKRQKTLEEKAK